ncbi:MAG: gamma-glutamyl-gamma-aminobutyrate hydrolase family protein [Planctomycetota bacterium]
MDKHPEDRPARPVIAIAGDVDRAPGTPPMPRAACRLGYVDAVAAAGGLPLVVPPRAELLGDVLGLADGVLLIGGDDPRTEPFGVPTDPRVTPVDPLRQAFDVALLGELGSRPELPVLGVCYGMQMMALIAGGRLDQHLPDTLGAAADVHWGGEHAIEPVGNAPAWLREAAGERPCSRHRQAMTDAGALDVIGVAPDGVIEAVRDASRTFFVGVQWHPERSGERMLGLGVYRAFVSECVSGRMHAALGGARRRDV